MKRMLMERWNRPWTGTLIDERTLPAAEELGSIIAVVEELMDWLLERYDSVKQKVKEQTEQFKEKIRKFKELNGRTIPVKSR